MMMVRIMMFYYYVLYMMLRLRTCVYASNKMKEKKCADVCAMILRMSNQTLLISGFAV